MIHTTLKLSLTLLHIWPAYTVLNVSVLHFSVVLWLFWKLLTKHPGRLKAADADPTISSIADLVESNQNPSRFCIYCEVRKLHSKWKVLVCVHWYFFFLDKSFWLENTELHFFFSLCMISADFILFFYIMLAVPSGQLQALSPVWPLCHGLRSPLPFPKPLCGPEQPPCLFTLRPGHDSGPALFRQHCWILPSLEVRSGEELELELSSNERSLGAPASHHQCPRYSVGDLAALWAV